MLLCFRFLAVRCAVRGHRRTGSHGNAFPIHNQPPAGMHLSPARSAGASGAMTHPMQFVVMLATFKSIV